MNVPTDNRLYELSEEFDNDDINHFTHYDYLLQVIENGQPSAFRAHIKTISKKSLLQFLQIMPQRATYKTIVLDEILGSDRWTSRSKK